MIKNFLLLSLSFILSISYAQNTNISGVINNYATVSAISGNSLTVNSSVGFAAGDLVLIIQMKGANMDETNSAAFGDIVNLNSAGNYEITSVCSIISPTEIGLSSIQRTYDPTNAVQLVRVPEYNDATVTSTLTANAWDGTSGGILALKCKGSLTLNADIDVQGLGFMGGGSVTSSFGCDWWNPISDYFAAISSGEGALKGEGIATFITNKTAGRGAQTNGGGGGNDHNSGGGGGANAGAGGQGGERIAAGTFYCSGAYPGVGGKANSYNNTDNKIYLGGAGGAGHENNGGLNSDGGNGGGIVIIIANELIGNSNNIISTGSNAVLSEDGAGGGGAGGTVLLDIGTYTGGLSVNVSGANGGSVDNVGPSNCNGPGGGGGGGVLWINQAGLPGNITFGALAGAPGVTTTASQSNCTVGSSNNAQFGNPGTQVNDLNIPISGASQNGVDVITACDSLVWIDGNTYYSSNNTATHVLVGGSSSGCDSTVVLNLTLNGAAPSSTDSLFACDSLTWVDGVTYYASNNTATYTYFGGSSAGCDSTIQLNLTINQTDLFVIQSQQNLTASQFGANYQWINCATQSAISGATNQSYIATQNGDYAVIIELNGCTDTSACYTVSGMGTDELEKFSVNIFPNPAKDMVHIQLTEKYDFINLELRDLSGRLVFESTYNNTSKIELATPFTKGIYLLNISIDGENLSKRLLIE
ncbi:T9SS type A sorting domain-containing protein [Paracrocinitomix mangrovi]|uniref:T9SS type A sorting domain-containing protein n=1 Tax=Paracrocinitomix mangrovi TaxID=2862509 RepID=UPI001C8DF2AE|nr:T9SS type A sorting domain-containing protein [Paracrocinitomix mangrovi]UKN01210.1 T9SS type A sorting domain-containing protein [Paracrocinitomix mangrovi]